MQRLKLRNALLILLFVGLASSLIFGLTSTIPSAEAKSYSESDLKGAFSFFARGTIAPSPFPSSIPFVAVGIFTFDGFGLCTLSFTLRGGVSLPLVGETSDCTYTVNPDGTGTIVIGPTGPAGPENYSIVIVSRKEFHFIRTDTFLVAGGIATKQKGN